MIDKSAKNLYTLQDPTKQYPLPKFKHQTQMTPGSDRKLSPKADHGETSYRGSDRLPNRKALVTGGDSGIGRAAAIAFAREGADVAINYLPSEEQDAREVIALIEQEGRKVFALPGDISNEKFCRKLIKVAHKKLGGLDILACVAGKQHAVEKIADLTTEQLEETYRANVFALVWLCQEALPLMPPGGSIITTASIQATHPGPSLLDYAAYKGGDPGLYKGIGPSGRWRRQTSKQCCLRAGMDSATTERRATTKEDTDIRIRDAHETCRPARRNGTSLRFAGLTGIQLCHRRSLWGNGRP